MGLNCHQIIGHSAYHCRSWQVSCQAIGMTSRLIDTEGPRTNVLIFQTGDEVASGPKRFAEENGLGGSSFKAIGALSRVKVGCFNWETKKYETAVELDEQVDLRYSLC